MNEEMLDIIEKLNLPSPDSHKGQNGRLLVIGGSTLFHAASIWSLTVASRIVDLVHYCSVKENNKIVHELKKEFRNGIVIPRNHVEEYIQEDDVILIGPGMVRVTNPKSEYRNPKQFKNTNFQIKNIKQINEIQDEGEQTYYLTNYLTRKYPEKQWVIDAGALQMVELENIPKNAILTPHHQEFELLLSKSQITNHNVQTKHNNQNSKKIQSEVGKNFVYPLSKSVEQFAKTYSCTVLLKGKEDVASNGKETTIIEGGNAGMTKGGTGDVLAGLIAALACKNDPWTATLAGSYINKRAGDELYEKVGPFFNATDLANQIPVVMKELMSTRLKTR